MTARPAQALARSVNLAIRPLGVRIVRSHDASDPRQFLPLGATLAGAKEAGLSVADYVDVTYNVAGATQETIDQMAALGVFTKRVDSVVEVGPGSGRYLEKILRICSPSRYEFYETAQSWADYLLRTYENVISQPTDGRTMAFTATDSIDLAHAHKVFVATPFMTTCSYWLDMIRVARRNGHIIFDVVTEACMDPTTLEGWLESGVDHGPYPAIMPRDFAVDFFGARGVRLVGSFNISMKPGRTETFVFKKS